MGLNCERLDGNGVSMDLEMGRNSSEAIRMGLWFWLWMGDYMLCDIILNNRVRFGDLAVLWNLEHWQVKVSPSATARLLAASLFDRHTKGPELVSEEAGLGRRVRRTLCLAKSHNQPFCCVAEVRAGERPLQECHTRCPLRTYNAFLA